MAHKGIWLRPGYFIDSDIYAEFAACRTNDGKLTYWGFDPRSMSFEEAAAKLESVCESRGLKILPNAPKARF
jgi:hypothetical protein